MNSQIKDKLLEKRPNLSEKSLVTYISTLTNLPKKLNDNPKNISYFSDNVKKIISFLEHKPSRSRKSVLSPLYVLTDKEEYKILMNSDIQLFNENSKKQEKTEKEIKNWIKWEDVSKKHVVLQSVFNMGVKSSDLYIKTLSDMNLYVLLSLYVMIPPRRCLDYAVLKHQNYDKQKDNYVDLKKKVIVFNEYKTSKKYGTQTFPIPKNLLLVLKQWIKILNRETELVNSDYVIVTEDHNTVEITKLLNGIFKPKRVSCNMLRHSYVTYYYENKKGIPSLEELEQLASQMAHSVTQSLQYIRK